MIKIPYSTFSQRLVATLADLFLLSILMLLLKLALPDFSNRWFFNVSYESGNVTHWVLSRSSLIGLWIVYSVLMDCSALQGTFGKQLMRIAVTDKSGNRISLFQSLGRNLFKVISYAIAGLGFIYILVDQNNQGWHDKVANTLVLEKSKKI